MSIFGKSIIELRAERDELEALISSRAMELTGRMATVEETNGELRPLTTRLVDVNNKILRQTSADALRRERAELELALDTLKAPEDGSDPDDFQLQARQRASSAERMRLEWKINRLDEHLAQRSPEASMKTVLIFIGAAAIFGILLQFVQRAS